MPATTMAAVPQKWHVVYQGDNECRFFQALARGQEWRTTDGLAKQAKLTKEQVEKICSKYEPLGMVQQHSKEPNKWRYWENAPKKKSTKGTISGDNKKQRVEDKLKGKAP